MTSKAAPASQWNLSARRALCNQLHVGAFLCTHTAGLITLHRDAPCCTDCQSYYVAILYSSSAFNCKLSSLLACFRVILNTYAIDQFFKLTYITVFIYIHVQFLNFESIKFIPQSLHIFDFVSVADMSMHILRFQIDYALFKIVKLNWNFLKTMLCKNREGHALLYCSTS